MGGDESTTGSGRGRDRGAGSVTPTPARFDDVLTSAMALYQPVRPSLRQAPAGDDEGGVAGPHDISCFSGRRRNGRSQQRRDPAAWAFWAPPPDGESEEAEEPLVWAHCAPAGVTGRSACMRHRRQQQCRPAAPAKFATHVNRRIGLYS